MPDILHRVGIQASAEKVYWALTDEEGLAGWWTRNVKAPSGVGSVIEFRFDDKGFKDMKVLELIPVKRMRWQCVEPRGYAEAIVSICKLYAESPLACVSGVTGSNLKKRIEEIMANRVKPGLSATKKLVLAAGGLLVVTIPVVVGISNVQLSAQTGAVRGAGMPWQAAARGKIEAQQNPQPAPQPPPQQPKPQNLFEPVQQAPREEPKREPPNTQIQTVGREQPPEDIIEAINFRGSQRVPQDTLRAIISIKPGDPYNEDAMRRDFLALWNTGRFDDMRMEREAGQKGWIIRYVLHDR